MTVFELLSEPEYFGFQSLNFAEVPNASKLSTKEELFTGNNIYPAYSVAGAISTLHLHLYDRSLSPQLYFFTEGVEVN